MPDKMMLIHFTEKRAYARSELVADGAVHGFALIAAAAGVAAVVAGARPDFGFAIYVCGLFAMLGFSAAYNLAPVSRAKWLLRRFDHSAIYLLIAATYTPLILRLQEAWLATVLTCVVWGGAAFGIAIKVFLPGRFDVLAVGAYLALGWVGILAASAFWAALPVATIALIVAGGLLYSAGVPFYLWDKLKFQNAIWHGFVAVATACHFVAIAWLYV